jgi:hypothetical protein
MEKERTRGRHRCCRALAQPDLHRGREPRSALVPSRTGILVLLAANATRGVGYCCSLSLLHRAR